MDRIPPFAFIAGAIVLGVIALALLIGFRPDPSGTTPAPSGLESQNEGVIKGFDAYSLPGSSITPPVRPAPSPAPQPGVVCTMDAMQCPDGSYVGRVPPNCQFAPCPGN